MIDISFGTQLIASMLYVCVINASFHFNNFDSLNNFPNFVTRYLILSRRYVGMCFCLNIRKIAFSSRLSSSIIIVHSSLSIISIN